MEKWLKICVKIFSLSFLIKILKKIIAFVSLLMDVLYSYRFSDRVQCYCIELGASRAEALLHKFDNLCLVLMQSHGVCTALKFDITQIYHS